jgi:outer membrane immunogenic protein
LVFATNGKGAADMIGYGIRGGIAIAALFMASVAAQAADLGQPYRPELYAPAPIANWTGGYIGANFGYGFGNSDWSAPAVTESAKGGLAGATIGYNYQTGVWVWGLEGDWDWTNMKGDADCGVLGTCTTKLNWLATGRARVGYAGWGNWMPYLTGGVAAGNVKVSTAVAEASVTRVGWTAGLGGEYAFTPNWSLRAEYLYVNLGDFDCSTACAVTGSNVSLKTNLVRGGLNFRF